MFNHKKLKEIQDTIISFQSEINNLRNETDRLKRIINSPHKESKTAFNQRLASAYDEYQQSAIFAAYKLSKTTADITAKKKAMENCRKFLIDNATESIIGKKVASTALLSLGMQTCFKNEYQGYISQVSFFENSNSKINYYKSRDKNPSLTNVLIPSSLIDTGRYLTHHQTDAKQEKTSDLKEMYYLTEVLIQRQYITKIFGNNEIADIDKQIKIEKLSAKHFRSDILKTIVNYSPERIVLLSVNNMYSVKEVWSPEIEEKYVSQDLADLKKKIDYK